MFGIKILRKKAVKLHVTFSKHFSFSLSSYFWFHKSYPFICNDDIS